MPNEWDKKLKFSAQTLQNFKKTMRVCTQAIISVSVGKSKAITDFGRRD